MSRRRRRRGSRSRQVLAVAGAALVGAALFLAGLGLGRTLEERPRGGVRTQVRTLRPLPLPPARETVTVRVTVTQDG